MNSVEISKENQNSLIDFFETLDDNDDVQNVYSNVKLEIINDDYWNRSRNFRIDMFF